ncbi:MULTISPECIES: DEAD/DEAH box helicase [unclassified Microbacterium]|uniref:DEAD/DEAH box helicase n=1 Tax=unclassified Microbacterium TaxID=2609290 RepID=UPI0004936B2F|nr:MULTISPECIES: DEAD/DEAH box helicase [unclassified Microbacterium]
MRASLERWIADAETRHTIADFALTAHLEQLDYLGHRSIDLYYSLVGELFDVLRSGHAEPRAWMTLGRGLVSVSRDLRNETRSDALFFAAVAFYSGGYPASAAITARDADPAHFHLDAQQAAYDLLTRSVRPSSESIAALIAAVRTGQSDVLQAAVDEARQDTARALEIGPDEWVAHRLHVALLERFRSANLRAVLPDGGAARWDRLVESFLDRSLPVWEFFPSQIEAIDAGLLSSDESYSLQMPTGAGKTALTEALIFNQLAESPDGRAVLLVPYRALAKELRGTVGRHLSGMGLHTRTIYGGTVPGVEDAEDLDSVRVFIATPEAMTGLLGAHSELLPTISLVVCDEGHLLGSESRGIGLELLLSRFNAQAPAPRVIFLSAIVPNVEEINSWLGGNDSTVVRSEYRPSIAEYATLRQTGAGQHRDVSMELYEPSTSVPAHVLPSFLSLSDFQFLNRSTGRLNTFKFDSTKTQAVAAARKALTFGSVAIFATEKGGNRGVMGLAHELLKQLDAGLPLPAPLSHAGDSEKRIQAIAYLSSEYGPTWVGSRSLEVGAVLHHGDVPQETREVLEELVAARDVPLVMCTSTLAEGVNLPIRTMVLYSVRRSTDGGASTPMLARDIKNLVGRAGRAGASTRGLVICANSGDWESVKSVAEGQAGEPLAGALLDLIQQLRAALNQRQIALSNELLDRSPALSSLTDGVDASLIELIRDELGADEFIQIAQQFAVQTFAAARGNETEKALLVEVFKQRAEKLVAMRTSGRLDWVRESAAKPRLVDSVVDDLFPRVQNWTEIDSPLDEHLVKALVSWSLDQPGFARQAETAFRGTTQPDLEGTLVRIVLAWIAGRSFTQIAAATELDIDVLLRVHAQVVLFDLLTLIEQAVSILRRMLEETGGSLAPAVVAFPDFLRFGVSTTPGRELMARGVRHRRAAVELGEEIDNGPVDIMTSTVAAARRLLGNEATWRPRLGDLVYARTAADVRLRSPRSA